MRQAKAGEIALKDARDLLPNLRFQVRAHGAPWPTGIS